MTFIERRNALVAALSTAVGCPVLLSDQVQPEAQPPYIVYSVTADYIPDAGLGDYTFRETGSGEDTSLAEVRAEQPSCTISFSACSVNRWKQGTNGEKAYIFGEDEAQELAARAQGFFIHTGEDVISSAGFVVVDVSNAGSRSAIVIDEMARRYGFDVRLRYRRTDERDVGTVQKATPKGETTKE
ncbi:LIC_12616 family protein [Faecalispora jeddahensis]|uniref:phage neck terminator protein n=1 Tax=Faecalispora jeddahensis TaxID=1414721 RepID=UPI0027B94CFA|nr:hypothetical protein [Faecalispora jeddahensis]